MGLDDEQKKTDANGVRRAVEARRSDPGRETTAAQEQRSISIHSGKDGGCSQIAQKSKVGMSICMDTFRLPRQVAENMVTCQQVPAFRV